MELSKLIGEFRNNVMCRYDSNQAKAQELFKQLMPYMIDYDVALFNIEWRHFMFNEITVSEFGEYFKKYITDTIIDPNEKVFNELRERLKLYKDTLVLNYFKVYKLNDVVKDHEDFYWVLRESQSRIVHDSCVGEWIPLKGVIPDKDYNELVRVWNLNNKDKAI